MSDEEDENGEKVENLINFGPNERIRNWVIVRELGKGQFGKVYHVIHMKTGKEGAMKVEYPCKDSLLKMEAEVIAAMAKQPKVIQLLQSGRVTDCNYLVMTICGPDLTKVSLMLNKKFSDSTILRVSVLTLFSIKALHEVGYIHRDLKPCNMALGYQRDSTMIYLLDFGMARKFARKSSKNVWVIRYPRSQPRFRGSLRYCSMNMHRRIELGRVDDLWSWFYMMIEMKGDLPWGNATHPDKVEIMKKELIMSFMNKHPFLSVFLPIMDHLNSLTYPDRPDYLMLHDTIKSKMDELDVKFSDPYDFDEMRKSDNTEALEIAAKNEITIQNDAFPRDDEKIKEILLNGFTPKKEDLPGGVQHLAVQKANFLLDLKGPKVPKSAENANFPGDKSPLDGKSPGVDAMKLGDKSPKTSGNKKSSQSITARKSRTSLKVMNKANSPMQKSDKNPSWKHLKTNNSGKVHKRKLTERGTKKGA